MLLPPLSKILQSMGLPHYKALYEEVNIDTPKEIYNFVEFFKDKVKPLHMPRILIVGDGDNDGFVATKVAYKTLYRDYAVDFIFPKGKSHGINELLMDILFEDYQVVIIVDSATNDFTALNTLLIHDKIVIVIDHHKLNQTPYPIKNDNFFLLNCKMFENTVFHDLSAGYLTYMAMEALKPILNKTGEDLFDLAITSIYSDECSLRNEFNRSIVNKAYNRTSYSEFLSKFMTKYDRLDVNFVSWNYAPRINNLFRMEHLDVVENLILEDNLESSLKLMDMFYQSSKAVRDDLLLSSSHKSLDNLVFVDLTNTKSHIYSELNAYNFTGMIANEMASKYLQASLVCYKYFDGLEYKYKCSFRDFYNRNVFPVLSSLPVSGGGHKSAFGFTCDEKDIFKVVNYLDKYIGIISLDMEYIKDKINIVNISTLSELNTLSNLNRLEEYAKYNTIAGTDLMPIFIKSFIGYQPTITLEKNRTVIRDRKVQAVIFDKVYNRSTLLKLKPKFEFNNSVRLIGEIAYSS